MKTFFRIVLLYAVFSFPCVIHASTPAYFAEMQLAEAFAGAQEIDLTTSKEPAVVKLRDVVGIPAPIETVYVKTFDRNKLPAVLEPAFATKGIVGVTINGRYIAILKTEFEKEHHDILQHELVHAYITLASPRMLPFWFQEGSAVHFSTDKGSKFYGKPSDTQVGVMIGKHAELTETYKQKLGNFHFLIEKVGKEKFYEWYKEAVVTGNVNAKKLLVSASNSKKNNEINFKGFPIWMIALAAAVVIGIIAAGFYTVKSQSNTDVNV